MDPQLLAGYPGACGVGAPVQAAPLLDPCHWSQEAEDSWHAATDLCADGASLPSARLLGAVWP